MNRGPSHNRPAAAPSGRRAGVALAVAALFSSSSSSSGLATVRAQSDGGGDGGGDCSCAAPGESIVIQRCDPNDALLCQANCRGIHGVDLYLADKCCAHAGRSASLLAFEEDDKWVTRIEEYNRCTGASVRLEYLAEGEDGMADALRMDVGEDMGGGQDGEGMFDAYIVQAPWLPPVVYGLANLSPLIRENADTVKFLDINPASRSAVSYNGTVRALPLDTDYIAIGWRQDVFHKHGVPLEPPKTIHELADLAERLNGLDHNDDGVGDWGVCLTPQVNYFYAFVAPIFQTHLNDPETGTQTGQNMFFDADTFEPLIRVPGFREGLEQYWRIIRASNCQDQLANGEKCDRKKAFPTGRCAMVVSMPGTLTNMLREGGKYAPEDRMDAATGEVEWSISDQPLGDDVEGPSYWGRRAPFPGSKTVQSWDKEAGRPLASCEDDGGAACPLAGSDGINYAPFFAEGGEAYALNGRQSKPAATAVMWDLFTWLSELPVTKLPLSGQYRKTHLDDEHRTELLEAGWPETMIEDLFGVLDRYFLSEKEGGNPVQDLLMLGFPEYMGALDEELHDRLLGVKTDSAGGLFDRDDPSRSIDPVRDGDVFDEAYESFVDALEARYDAISKDMSGGHLGQLQRWRQSLNLPWRSDEELCTSALEADVEAFRRLECQSVVDLSALCQTQPESVQNYDENLCAQESSRAAVIVPSVIIPLAVVAAIAAYVIMERRKRHGDSVWAVKVTELHFDDPPVIVGRGTFGLVLLAEYRGTHVAVKRVIPPQDDSGGKKGPKDSNQSSGAFVQRTLLGKGDLTEEEERLKRRQSFNILEEEEFEPDETPELQEQSQMSGSLQSIFDIKDGSDGSAEALGKSSQSGTDATVKTAGTATGTASGTFRNQNIRSESGSSFVLQNGSGALASKSDDKSISFLKSLKLGLRNRDDRAKLKADFIAEMRHLSKLRHPCITTVMGAVIDKREEPMLVMEYMELGSLYDLLHNETVPLDGDLLLPILRDIAQGLRFLHAADPKVIHGDLKAQNILVDSKFRAKVADFGLSQKREVGATGTPLWMAPELLRGESDNSPASDVYSFGIILYECYARKEPYFGEGDLHRVLRQVVNPKVNKRPPVPEACPPQVATLMKECVEGDPASRPTFEEIDLRLKRLNADNAEPGEMHLSAHVRKTIQATKAENLLYDVFPPHIADALRDGRKVEQESHECVTIFFSDIVGFTTISQASTPEKVCNMLDRLYERFDDLSRKHDIFKIETIGDAYMAITNLVKDQNRDHVKRCAEFSFDAIKAASETLIDVDDPSKGYVRIRVGFHSGPVISNVVGTRLPKYGVFGDTVNTSSRMESNSEPGRVHCSEASAKLLQEQAPEIQVVSRGAIQIKGKGEMNTFWVNEENDVEIA